MSCDDGDSCTSNDRCNGAGVCEGSGTTPAVDSWDAASDNQTSSSASDLSYSVNDDGNATTTVTGTFHRVGDVDWYRYTLQDESQCCLGPCFASTKQPRPYGTVESGAAEVCLRVVCSDGSLESLSCEEGTKDGFDTCCGDEVRIQHDCDGQNDSATIQVKVSGSACGGYEVRVGNADSGCGW